MAPVACLIDAADTRTAAEWDAYVDAHPDATVYHRAAWSGLMQRTLGHLPRYLAARRDGRISGVLPLVLFRTPLFGRFAVSMPFVNYGGVLADDQGARDALFEAAVAQAREQRASYLELRHAARVFEDLPARSHKVAMILRLEATPEQQWDALDKKLRNQVRKARKEGLASKAGGVELIDDFYAVLAQNMRDLGSPVHARRLFEDILRTFPDRTRLLGVYLNGRPIAASFVIWNGRRIEVPWASSIREFNPLCANVLLYWDMLEFSIQRGFSEFDFGRSTPHEGTYKFKEQWGAEPRQLHWEYWLDDGVAIPDRSPQNPKFGSAIALWQRLPVAATRALGPFIVRNIP